MLKRIFSTVSFMIGIFFVGFSHNLMPIAKFSAIGEFRDASRVGDIAGIKKAIENKVDINMKIFDDMTALYVAVTDNFEEAARLLIEAGADTEIEYHGKTPLYYACAFSGLATIVKLLLEGGANRETTYRASGWTPLMVAAERGNDEIVRILLDAGAAIEAAVDGGTALYIAAQQGHTSIVRLLLERGADVEPVMKLSNVTALYIASQQGHTSVVNLLLDRGAQIGFVDPGGYTPLHVAASFGRQSTVDLLLNRGANIEAKSHNGWTPLFNAVLNDHKSVVNLLLDKGANREAVNNDGLTALTSAAEKDNKEMIKLLLDRDATIGIQDAILLMRHAKGELAGRIWNVIKWPVTGVTAVIALAGVGVWIKKYFHKFMQERLSQAERVRQNQEKKNRPDFGIPRAHGFVSGGIGCELALETTEALQKAQEEFAAKRAQELLIEDEKKKAESKAAQEKRENQTKKIETLRQEMKCLQDVLERRQLLQPQFIVAFQNALNALLNNQIPLSRELHRAIRGLLDGLVTSGKINFRQADELAQLANKVNQL